VTPLPNLPDFARIDVRDSPTFRNAKLLVGVTAKDDWDTDLEIVLGQFTVNDAFLLREAANEIVYAVGHQNLRIEHTHQTLGERAQYTHSHIGGALKHDTHPEDNDQLKGQDTAQQADDEEFNERQPQG
jgi:hypothetical protein